MEEYGKYTSFSIVEAFKFGFTTFYNNMLFFLTTSVMYQGIILLVAIIFFGILIFPQLFENPAVLLELKSMQAIQEYLKQIIEERNLTNIQVGGLVSSIVVLISIVHLYLYLGFLKIGLKFYDSTQQEKTGEFGFLPKPASFATLFSQIKKVPQGYIVQLIYFLLLGIGLAIMLLGIWVPAQVLVGFKGIPGGILKIVIATFFMSVGIIALIIALVRYYFALFFVVDKGTGIWHSFKASTLLTFGSRLRLFSFIILVYLFSNFIRNIGIIGMILGLFVTPIVILSQVYVYRTLQERVKERSVIL